MMCLFIVVLGPHVLVLVEIEGLRTLVKIAPLPVTIYESVRSMSQRLLAEPDKKVTESTTWGIP